MSVLPRVGNISQCLGFLSLIYQMLLFSSNPLPFFSPAPWPFPPLHPVIFPSDHWAWSYPWIAAPGPKPESLGTWPGRGARTERKFLVTPERCGSQWGCRRCSSRPWPKWQCLQWQKEQTLIEPLIGALRWIFGKEIKHLMWKCFFPLYGMGREDPDDSQFRSTMKRKLMLYKKRKRGYRKWRRAGRWGLNF